MTNYTLRGSAPGSPVDAKYDVVSDATTPAAAPGRVLPARVVDFRPISEGDVALLKVESTDLPTALLAADSDVQVGASVLSVGYPGNETAVIDQSLAPSVKDGQISARQTSGTVPVYEISAALTHGMSGGPTIDLNARVLGVNSFATPGESQPFNFITPSSELSELLARNGVRNELSPDDIAFRSALTAYYSGHYTDAIAGFNHTLQVHPQYLEATQFRTLATRAFDRSGDASEPTTSYPLGLSPTLFWSLLAVVGAVILAGILTTLKLSRKPKLARQPLTNLPTQHPSLSTWVEALAR
jgi:hypothetical protein